MADLLKIFEAINSQMLTDFDKIHSQIEHMGGRGGEREANLRMFLEAYLPRQYAIATGEIVDSKGNISRQCDLIIYDALTCPLLLAGQDYRVFPAESVYAVIEVKSVLDTVQLNSSIENIRSVKDLERANGKIGGIVFAYKSNQKKNVIEKFTKQIIKRNTSLLPFEYVDLWCILDKGLISLVNEQGLTRLTDNLSERRMLSYHELGDPPVLLWFFVQLIDLLNGQRIIKPDYMSYTHVHEIGLVSLNYPASEDLI